MRVRPAAVAGQFYPADPVALAASVNALLAAAPAGGGRPTAVIAPHAGYPYSGAVAGAAYARLAACRGEVRRVVVLGPAHYVRLSGMAVPRVDVFATPLGPVAVDLEARRTALDLPAVVVSDRPHAPKHAIETQLPFLLHALGPRITLLPVLVGATPPAAVVELLAALLTGPQTVAVLSTDLSHYLDRDRARLRDTRTAEAILARDAAAIRPDDACGHHPLRGLLRYAADRTLDVELLRLATSADTGADPRRVVGYGAFALIA
jgi:AmmeMemoRadiSam system protein B